MAALPNEVILVKKRAATLLKMQFSKKEFGDT